MTCGSCAANRSSNGSPAPTPHGRAIAVLFTKTYGHVLTPGLTDLSPALPSKTGSLSSLGSLPFQPPGTASAACGPSSSRSSSASCC
jgi:hypothetical protein